MPKRSPNLITIRRGRKGTAGQWVVSERLDVKGCETISQQIWVTPDVDLGDGTFALTHLQSGFLILRGFPNEQVAKYCAAVLAAILPIEKWDAMGEVVQAFRRDRASACVYALPIPVQLWMARWGGPRAKLTRELPDIMRRLPA